MNQRTITSKQERLIETLTNLDTKLCHLDRVSREIIDLLEKHDEEQSYRTSIKRKDAYLAVFTLAKKALNEAWEIKND